MKTSRAFRRLKDEADIERVVNYLGLPVTRKGSAYFIPCPNPGHNDKHATNCYFKRGWKNVFCNACGKSMNAVDLIMSVTGRDFGPSVDLLWELSGRPSWYDPEWCRTGHEGKEELFSLSREELGILHMHMPSLVETPVMETGYKPEAGRGQSVTPTRDGGYRLNKTGYVCCDDFCSPKQFARMARGKAKEKLAFYRGMGRFFRTVDGALPVHDGTTCALAGSAAYAADVCKKVIQRADRYLK